MEGKPMRACRTIAIAALLLCAAGFSDADAGVIFDNTTTPTGARSFSGLQIGDEVNAAGSDRAVTLLEIGVTQQGVAGTADLQAWLYANDGPSGQPGTQLWQSAILDNVPLTGGNDLIPFPVPLVQVPNTFTWTVRISDTTPIAVGVPHFHPPTVGSSNPDYAWFGGPGSWTKLTAGNPTNLMARVTAVPEPASLGLLGLAGTCALARRRPPRRG
jgi:hypothetical protein